ncbi:MAG: fumarate hydratase [Dehalococcoidia bacterium]|nr:fumarate hydratase [Chloroflexota bacterium]MCH2525073.1 fumarate hydratase [Dehalococcoidia bacterium]MQF99819.1 fumarate hydratase [SAR202 cluster bacterium]|tara:strand:+ start:2797 stop:3642 length:846 start_codon:yes stop_codon:yes gene_type:complete
MREIHVSDIRDTVSRMSQEANFFLPDDVLDALKKARKNEEAPRAQKVLDMIVKNSEIAAEKQIALCQDTGTTVIFLEIGQDVHLIGGHLIDALSDGVRSGYKEGFLRNSIVNQPFSARINTGDNTPPIVHTDIVPGEDLKITILPKGGGCENMSRLAILRPGDGKKGVIDFTLKAIEESGGNPCPPLIVGVGIGGTAEHVMHMAKKSLLRKVGELNPDPEVAELEQELLEIVNASGIGPQAWGGRSTALAVNIETHPTHITSLPVGVNLQCHSARLKTATI